MWQQGDVIIERVNNIKGKKLNHLTLAQGEVTGHHHTITKGDAELYENNGTLYLRANSECELTHQEHNTIEIAPDTYWVVRQREYSPEEIRRVAD